MGVYNWDSIPSESTRKGHSRKGFRGQNTLLVLNELQPGTEERPHSHDFEQMNFILKGKALFQIGDETYEVGAGTVLTVPPGKVHTLNVIGEEPVLTMGIFSPVREDYLHLTKYQEEP